MQHIVFKTQLNIHIHVYLFMKKSSLPRERERERERENYYTEFFNNNFYSRLNFRRMPISFAVF